MKKPFSLVKNDQKLALLIDPDWASDSNWLNEILINLSLSNIDVILIGGSIVKAPDTIDALIAARRHSRVVRVTRHLDLVFLRDGDHALEEVVDPFPHLFG